MAHGGGFGSTQSSGHYLDPARWVGRTLTTYCLYFGRNQRVLARVFDLVDAFSGTGGGILLRWFHRSDGLSGFNAHRAGRVGGLVQQKRNVRPDCVRAAFEL
jgi:hypothetical protein